MLYKIKKLLEKLNEENYNLDLIEKNNDNIINILKNKKIVIYPAGTNGQLLQKTLSKNNITIDSFYDKAFENLKKINDIDVKNPEEFSNLSDEYVVIVSINIDNQFIYFQNKIEKMNQKVEILNGKNLNRLLKSPTCLEKLNNKKVFDLIECENCGFERKKCPIASKYLKNIGNYREIKEDLRSDKFDWFGYIISQNCSLKCEHCCEQVPYLKDKRFSSVEEIVKDVKKIAENTKFLNFVELVGGEPLLHPEIERLISELLKINNIGYIKSFTNGTIVPSDELCNIMKNSRFMLQISNYELAAKGKLLKNIYKTKEKLDTYKIKYLFTKNFEWLDFSSFEKHEASEAYLKNAFNKCFLKNCNRVYKGKLYRCPHHYAGIQRGRLKEYSHECIDIHSHKNTNLGQVLTDFENLELLDACKYCDLAFDAKPVPAGKQIGE